MMFQMQAMHMSSGVLFTERLCAPLALFFQ